MNDLRHRPHRHTGLKCENHLLSHIACIGAHNMGPQESTTHVAQWCGATAVEPEIRERPTGRAALTTDPVPSEQPALYADATSA